MGITCLIPARAGSRRLPGKNLKLLGGRPLMAWTIESAVESGVYDEILVCTDDESVRTADLPHRNLWDVWWRKPVPDTQCDHEWVTDVISVASNHDQFSILRPTSPFRDAETIRQAHKQWLEVRDSVDSMRAVRKVSEHPFKCWVMGEPGTWRADQMRPFAHYYDCVGVSQRPFNCPTQELDTVYVQTAGLEFSWTRNLEDPDSPSISGEVVAPFVVDGPASLDINTEWDWVIAEAYVSGRLGNAPLRSG